MQNCQFLEQFRGKSNFQVKGFHIVRLKTWNLNNFTIVMVIVYNTKLDLYIFQTAVKLIPLMNIPIDILHHVLINFIIPDECFVKQVISFSGNSKTKK